MESKKKVVPFVVKDVLIHIIKEIPRLLILRIHFQLHSIKWTISMEAVSPHRFLYLKGNNKKEGNGKISFLEIRNNDNVYEHITYKHFLKSIILGN